MEIHIQTFQTAVNFSPSIPRRKVHTRRSSLTQT